MRFPDLTHLESPRDGRGYYAGVPQELYECRSPLLTQDDLTSLAEEVRREETGAKVGSWWRRHKSPQAHFARLPSRWRVREQLSARV